MIMVNGSCRGGKVQLSRVRYRKGFEACKALINKSKINGKRVRG